MVLSLYSEEFSKASWFYILQGTGQIPKDMAFEQFTDSVVDSQGQLVLAYEHLFDHGVSAEVNVRSSEVARHLVVPPFTPSTMDADTIIRNLNVFQEQQDHDTLLHAALEKAKMAVEICESQGIKLVTYHDFNPKLGR